jgi:hypothetical protein
MTDPLLPPEADALDRYLNGDRTHRLPPGDAALTDSLMAAAASAQPDPSFAAALEKRLSAKAAHRQKPVPITTPTSARTPFWSDSMRKFSAFATVSALMIILLAGGVWLSALNAPDPTTAPGGASTEAVTESAIEATTIPTETATPLPATDPAALNPDLAFPDGPTHALLYNQLPMSELTVEQAKQVAAQFGVNGNVYQHIGEGGESQVIYEVTDGTGNVRFIGSTEYFNITPDERRSFEITGEPLPFEQRASVVDQFLQSLGLSNFDYRLEPSEYDVENVLVARLLDGYRVMFNQNPESGSVVTVSSDGKMQSFIGLIPQFQELGAYPIISAREAWVALNSGASIRGVSGSSTSVTPLDSSYRTWVPDYKAGDKVDVYGYPTAFHSVEGLEPMVAINNLKIFTGTEALAAASVSGQFAHVWGEYQPDGFVLEGWETTTLPDDMIMGTIEREGGVTYLNEGEQRWVMKYVPDTIPSGTEVEARGVKVNGGEIVWMVINTPLMGGGGGGGGGGGNSFAEVVLTPQVALPTPTPLPYPYAVGDQVEGLPGMLYALFIRQADDSLVPDYTLWADPTDTYPQIWPLQLKGAVDGIEILHYLPVRVWGVVTGIGDQGLEVEVERYEEAYPGMRLQSWIGTQEVLTLDNREVMLFTTTDGQQYVLMNSTTADASGSRIGNPGDLVIVDGYAIPGDTLSGYPTIQDLSLTIASAASDLATHINAMATPGVGLPAGAEATASSGYTANPDDINTVELVYLASDFTHGWPPPPADCTCRIVQPMWRFAGTTADGQVFSIIVQALADKYLKQP